MLVASDLLVIASFGILYPPVAFVGAARLALNAYVAPLRFAVARAAVREQALVPEGVRGIPTTVVAVTLVVQTLMLYFMFGPLGLLDAPVADVMLAFALLCVLPAVVFGNRLLELWLRCQRATHAARARSTHSVSDSPVMPVTGKARRAEEIDEASRNRELSDQYAASFAAWAERAAAWADGENSGDGLGGGEGVATPLSGGVDIRRL